jgi:hypothetical protein
VPRQLLSATPYAMHAASAPGGGGTGPGRTHITGELILRGGNIGYVDATTGGGAAHVGPSG